MFVIWGWTAIRVFAGLFFATHGWAKLFGPVPGGGARLSGLTATVEKLGLPGFLAWAAAGTELVGGVLLAIGLVTRGAAAACLGVMGVALFTHRNDPFARMELAALYAVIWVAFLIGGAGPHSLDASVFRKKSTIFR